MIRVAITGSNGFIGNNLKLYLKQKDIETIEIHRETQLKDYKNLLSRADFLVHLAGVNRSDDKTKFKHINVDLTKYILSILSKSNQIPILFSSSTKVSENNEYGISKKHAENLILDYHIKTKKRVHILRLPNVFGKWSKPNYNSFIATACDAITKNKSINLFNAFDNFEVVYIMDIIMQMHRIILDENQPVFTKIHRITSINAQSLYDKLIYFRDCSVDNHIPNLKNDFDKNLFSTFKYFENKNILTDLQNKVKSDERGNFLELFKSDIIGQVSLNTIRPGKSKGKHWHNTKVEIFWFIKGKGTLKLFDLRAKKTVYIEVDKIPSKIDITPGTWHEIKNTGNEDLIFLIWSSDIFDQKNPDTFYE